MSFVFCHSQCPSILHTTRRYEFRPMGTCCCGFRDVVSAISQLLERCLSWEYLSKRNCCSCIETEMMSWFSESACIRLLRSQPSAFLLSAATGKDHPILPLLAPYSNQKSYPPDLFSMPPRKPISKLSSRRFKMYVGCLEEVVCRTSVVAFCLLST